MAALAAFGVLPPYPCACVVGMGITAWPVRQFGGSWYPTAPCCASSSLPALYCGILRNTSSERTFGDPGMLGRLEMRSPGECGGEGDIAELGSCVHSVENHAEVGVLHSIWASLVTGSGNAYESSSGKSDFALAAGCASGGVVRFGGGGPCFQPATPRF